TRRSMRLTARSTLSRTNGGISGLIVLARDSIHARAHSRTSAGSFDLAAATSAFARFLYCSRLGDGGSGSVSIRSSFQEFALESARVGREGVRTLSRLSN